MWNLKLSSTTKRGKSVLSMFTAGARRRIVDETTDAMTVATTEAMTDVMIEATTDVTIGDTIDVMIGAMMIEVMTEEMMTGVMSEVTEGLSAGTMIGTVAEVAVVVPLVINFETLAAVIVETVASSVIKSPNQPRAGLKLNVSFSNKDGKFSGTGSAGAESCDNECNASRIGRIAPLTSVVIIARLRAGWFFGSAAGSLHSVAAKALGWYGFFGSLAPLFRFSSGSNHFSRSCFTIVEAENRKGEKEIGGR